MFKENLLISFNLESSDENLGFPVDFGTADKIMGVLEGPSEDVITIAGREVSVTKAARNLQAALQIVDGRVGDLVGGIDLSKMEFKALEGNVVAQSTESKMTIDPVMLLHPSLRLAYAIAHEMFHQGAKVVNEELVDALAKKYFRDSDLLSVYDVRAMEDFAEKSNLSLDEIFEAYLKHDFDSLYLTYQKGCMDANMDKEDTMKKFRALFPELTFVREPGEWTSVWEEELDTDKENKGEDFDPNTAPDEVIEDILRQIKQVG